MILFKAEHVEAIRTGRKTQTRRFWKGDSPRVKVGNVYQARTRMLDKSSTFALLRVTALKRQTLGVMTQEDAEKEGNPSLLCYQSAFVRINRLRVWPDMAAVWVVDFEVVEAL